MVATSWIGVPLDITPERDEDGEEFEYRDLPSQPESDSEGMTYQDEPEGMTTREYTHFNDLYRNTPPVVEDLQIRDLSRVLTDEVRDLHPSQIPSYLNHLTRQAARTPGINRELVEGLMVLRSQAIERATDPEYLAGMKKHLVRQFGTLDPREKK